MSHVTSETAAAGLPAEVTSFRGRTAELTDLRRRIGEHRMITLTGPGGVGKTRLALRAAALLRRAFAEAVTFVDLEQAESEAGVVRLIAAALEPGFQPSGSTSEEQVVARLRRGRGLLILDGCESAPAAVAAVAAQLLRTCPQLVVMATSRQRLDVMGESLLPVRPLELPRFAVRQASLAAVASVDAVALFLDRARAVRPDFDLNDRNVQEVVDLCTRVDGLPLAIELLAARMRAMSPRQVLDRLGDDFSIAAAAQAGAPPRHRTLEALIAGSYESCSDDERLLWERASVFAGSFDLADIENVCCDERLPVPDVADVVTRLVDKSVLVTDMAGGRSDFRLLATLRSFARGRSLQRGEREMLQARHAAWYGQVAQEASATWLGPGQRDRFDRLRGSYGNLLTAFEHLLSTASHRGEYPAAALGMAAELRFFWLMTGRVHEGRDWLDRALTLCPLGGRSEPAQRAMLVDAYLAAYEEEPQAVGGLLAQAAAQGDPLSPVNAFLRDLVRGLLALVAGDLDDAMKRFHDAALTARGHREHGRLREALFLQGFVLALRGDTSACRAVCDESASMTSPSADDWGRSYFRWLEAFAAFCEGDLRRARIFSQDTWQAALELGDQNMASWSMYLVALCLAGSGDRHRAALIHGHLRAAGSPMLLAVLERELPAKGRATGSWDEASLARGGRMTSAELAAMVISGPGQSLSGTTGPDVLSPREVEVALLIGEGLSNQEIAERLVISKRTAEGHAQRVFAKLALDRNQLAAWAAERHGRGTD